MASTMLELTNIHKAFGDNQVLRGIAPVVDKGEVLAVLGAADLQRNESDAHDRPSRVRYDAVRNSRRVLSGDDGGADVGVQTIGGVLWQVRCLS